MESSTWSNFPLKIGLLWALAAAACFHLAYEFDSLRGLIVGFAYCLVPLTRLDSSRKAFYVGLALGFGIYAPQLGFFWTIFQQAAVALWLVLAFWIGLFVLLGRWAVVRLGRRGLILLPVIWLGLEFFRSEVYYLRFSWLTPGGAFAGSRVAEALGILGVYGIGALLFALAVGAWVLPETLRVPGVGLVVALASLGTAAPPKEAPIAGTTVEIAGVQLEFPDEDEVLSALDRLSRTQTNASLFVLSEYTFKEPVPPRIKAWCRDRKKFLVLGAEDPAGATYFNTAFVIGPDGNVIFQQAKSVPIQFFNDGLPAREQRPWASPWGRIGFGICYDLSYRRVVDRLVTQGAQALIFPTMDVVEWGERQHRLHARVAPMRAAELGVPIFRLCSSGISQAVEGGGRVTATAPCPGQGASIVTSMVLGHSARLPWDHWMGPGAVGLTGLLLLMSMGAAARRSLRKE